MNPSPTSITPPPPWLNSLKWLRCPVSGANLIADGQRLVSSDESTRLAYPIADEIPQLLSDRAVELSTEEWKSVITRPSSP